jgi:peptidoglycan/LPS O-acetylase OafA/YrhL
VVRFAHSRAATMSVEANARSGYRADIDGLRAISILSVLAFHARLPLVSSGFVGVDVFFVISGYLISSILIREFGIYQSMNVLAFWARRVRRLAPALLFVVFVVIVSSFFLLERISGEVGALAKAAISTLLLSANHFFLAESGDYFSASAETNPLLHMWSLSVEEQFYFVWPVLLLFCLRRWRLDGARYLALVMLTGSFALCCYLTFANASAAFYLMPSRSWELMSGALLACVFAKAVLEIKQRAADCLSLAGLIILVASVGFPSVKEWFPGPAAALPVFGTILLLATGIGRETCVSRTLAFPPLVYVGKISYPLYLWHWPVLVVFRSRRLYQESIYLDCLALIVSVIFAIVTFELVEKRSWRSLGKITSKKVVSLGLTGSAVVLFVAVLVGIWARQGWGYSAEELRLNSARNDLPKLDCMFPSGIPNQTQLDSCYANVRKRTVLLWGDSHANHWRPAVSAAATSRDLNAATLTMNGCRPLSGPGGSDECVKFNQFVVANLSKWRRERGLIGLVLSARWPEGTGTLSPSVSERANWSSGAFFDKRAHSQYEALNLFEQELRAVLEITESNGLKTLLVLPSPVQKFGAAHCLATLTASECNITEAELDLYLKPAETVLRRVAGEFSSVRLVEPRKFVCKDGVCPVTIDGTIVYTDDDHLSKSFSSGAGREFEDGLAWISAGTD